jgi:hypothetical protein
MAIFLRIGIGLLLIIHGFAHYNIITVWGQRRAPSSWLLGGLGQGALLPLGKSLWLATLFAFIAAGLLAFFNVPAWRWLSVAGAGLSLLTIFLFWDIKMGIGAAVGVGILAGLLWLRWPPTALIG